MEHRWAFRSGYAEPRPGEAEVFARRISAAFRLASGLGGAIRWSWRSGAHGSASLSTCDSDALQWIQHVLLPSYPQTQWSPMPPEPPEELGPPRQWAVAVPDFTGPFRSVSDGDPSWAEGVLGVMASFPEGTRLDWEMRAVPSHHRGRAKPFLPELQPQPPGYRSSVVVPLARRLLADRAEERRLEPLWRLSGAIRCSKDRSAPGVAERLGRVVEAASRRPGGSGVGFRTGGWWRIRGRSLLMSSSEAAALLPTPWWRFPIERDARPDAARSLVVGTDGRGLVSRIWFEPEQGRHLLILGETGMGKSSLLVRLCRQVSGEHGLIVFDPIGDTALAAMAALPPRAIGRVLWVSPAHSPVGINALASIRPGPGGSPLRAERALGDLVAALRRVRAQRFSDTPFWGPRIEETLTQALRAAASFPGGTLEDAERLLSEPGRRPHGVPPEARNAVDELRTRVSERPEEVDGTRRLLAEITRNPLLTRMLCQREPRSAVADWVRPGQIVVVSGDASEVGEATSRYLLAILLALVWAELLSRPSPSKTFLALDEAQWYAHDAVAEAFRLGRRSNAHLWLATQAMASLPEAVREAARTNAADLVVYRGSPDEALDLHRWVPSVRPEILLSLPRGRAALLTGKGLRVHWVDIRAPTLARTRAAAADAAAEVSRSFWVPEPHDLALGTPSGPVAPTTAAVLGAAEFRGLLLMLWAAVLDADPSPRREIPIDAVRERFDPSGARLRRLGAELHRAGALTANRRRPDGHYWEIDREGLSRLLPGGVGADELASASARWREIAPSAEGVPSSQCFKRPDS